jgi:hypothetical protein
VLDDIRELRGNFQVDVDDGDVRLAMAHELERCLGGICRPEHFVSRILEHSGGTVRNNRCVLDDQYDHHTIAS